MSRRRQSLSPTLFPFLAVLVCTLGTLILLLALVAQNSSDETAKTAEAQAQPEEQPQSPSGLTVRQARELVEEEEFRLTELISFRDAQADDLGERRDQLAHVEDHLDRIQTELKQIGAAMQKAMDENSDPSKDRTSSEQRLEQLRQEISENEAVVKQLRNEVKTEKPRFVIVPHQGPNGTNRRPIYLECKSDRLIIWPEGVEITKWQLENSSERANPLNEALRAARYHVLKVYQDSEPPYPMLVVRPGGEETFYAAQAAMKNWDDQFGYELVPKQVELAYPKPDPEMRKRLEDIVRRAADRVSSRAVARSLSERSRRGIGVAQSGRRGTAVDQLGRDRTRQSRSGTDQLGFGAGGASDSDSNASAGGSGPRSYPTLSVSQMDREGRQSGFRDHRMFPGNPYGSRLAGPPANSREDAIADARQRLERQIESAAVDDSSSNSGPFSADPSALLSQNRSPQSGSGTQVGDSDSNRYEDINVQTKTGDEGSTTNERGNPSGERSIRSTAGASPSSRTPMNPYASQQAGGTSSASATPNASALGTASTRSQNQTQRNQQQQSLSASNERNANPPPVRRGGNGWALPNSVRLGRGNEIVRYLNVEVYADGLVILPSTRHRQREVFTFANAGIDQATLSLASTVRSRIDSWGAVASGSRWSPRLNVTVKPGAEAAFNQWSRLMIGSGLPIERSNAETSRGSGVTR